jgi:E3 SUMO-protein ligase PIAS1
MILSSYFEDILRETPESLEDVMVEADGEWHSQDNKYASPGWRASHPYVAPPPTPLKQRRPSPKPQHRMDTGKKAKPNGDAILVLDDSDEEDEGRVKRELSPHILLSADSSLAGTLPPHSQLSRTNTMIDNDVIDLTAEDDDELLSVQTMMPRKMYEKRKAPDNAASPTEQVWKKSRVESVRSNGHVNGAPATPAIPVYTSAPYPHASHSTRPPTSRTSSSSGSGFHHGAYASAAPPYYYPPNPGYHTTREGYHSQNRTNGTSRW